MTTLAHSLLALACVMVLLAGCRTAPHSPQPRPQAGLNVHLAPVVDGLDNPVAVTHAGDGSGRLFVTGQRGIVTIVHDGAALPAPFLDIRPLVSCCGERGLLSIAFHPGYADNGLFFVNYTDRGGDTVVARYRVSADPNRADPASGQVLLRIAQTAQIHNGGQIQFGPDGYLYIGTGDGGSFGIGPDEDSGGDPGNRAQNPGELLGKLLRIDVDRQDGYGIPPDNPFVGRDGARPEVWALGLRNPWRFSFDRLTGDLFIGDVGETRREEIDWQPAGRSGANYGWRRMEGNLCFKPPWRCNDGSLVPPIIEYSHDGGCAVIGGYRYRGRRIPAMDGTYLYADYCSRGVFGARRDADGNWRSRLLLRALFSVTSFGEDQEGELYVTGFGDGSGVLYRLTAGAAAQ